MEHWEVEMGKGTGHSRRFQHVLSLIELVSERRQVPRFLLTLLDVIYSIVPEFIWHT
jgi:hypothetical protein